MKRTLETQADRRCGATKPAPRSTVPLRHCSSVRALVAPSRRFLIPGFTLFELLVVMAIMALMATVGFAAFLSIGKQHGGHALLNQVDTYIFISVCVKAIKAAIIAVRPPIKAIKSNAVIPKNSIGKLACAKIAIIFATI